MGKALTFDFWRTLYRYDAPERERRAAMLGGYLRQAGYDFPLRQLLAANDAAWRRWAIIWEREHRTEDARFWLQAFLETLEAALPAALFEEAVVRLQQVVLGPDVRPVAGVAHLLPRLAERYPLGLISDTALTPGSLIRARLERDGLLGCFRHLSFSDEVGWSKPHPRIFRVTLEALGAAAAEAVHIGDIRRTDVAGGRGVGMRTIRFAGVTDDRDARWPEADGVAFDYAEVAALLQRWGFHAPQP